VFFDVSSSFDILVCSWRDFFKDFFLMFNNVLGNQWTKFNSFDPKLS
jgi:hypothetical protein